MKRIAIFTSGGDAPGMNACIRAVVRTGLHHGLEVFGIYRGYQGMIEGDIVPLYSASVSNIIQRGGTILKSSRSAEFLTKEGRQKAMNALQKYGIEGVVAMGGDGTFHGASVFTSEHGVPFVGIPCTIDNDLYGTDFTIGYDTAINTVVEAVDKIRDTATSHNRLFIVEVMGRDAGFIALRSGIASGADAIFVPETQTDMNYVAKQLQRSWARERSSSILIVAEGDEFGGAMEVHAELQKRFPEKEMRISILGHLQRGGNPSCMDRVLASRLGMAAVETLLEDKHTVMVGLRHRDITLTPFESAVKHNLSLNPGLLKLAETMVI
ncbi:MAG: 6-phosphofructokinase [Flavobacteriales bacterium]|nr:6-phosphofructokinase [Flavobacteriales bacterium]MCB9448627.1 6-phosphofructokinase [Flavobacteriales bacterium]